MFEELVAKTIAAQEAYASFTQEQVDAIFRAAAMAAAAQRIPLAQMAVAETGMGIVEDKVIKNHFAAEYIYNAYKDEKTCGILERDTAGGMMKIAAPVGVIAGVIPTTNPTSTAIFKALLALKTRNGIIFSPHPRAKKSTCTAAKIVHDAAVAAGAPEGIISYIEEPTKEATAFLMAHPRIAMILATGGPGMVKAAYSSGKPAIGVGAGNTPALIDSSADLRMAVSSIILSKTFDNGTICASEQSVIVVDELYEAVKNEFIYRGCHFTSPEEKQKLEGFAFDRCDPSGSHCALNANIVGQSPKKIAQLAGFSVPEGTKILIAECTKVGIDEPLSEEKLSPILAFYRVKNFEEGKLLAKKLVVFGGAGHTSVLYSKDQAHIEAFGDYLNTGRVLINMPSSQGAIGDIFNFRLAPSLTLGCGSWGGNSVSENIGVKHLLNIKSVAIRKENMLWFKVPPRIYFKPGCLPVALAELAGKKRAFIVTDAMMEKLGYVQRVIDIMEEHKIQVKVFTDVKPDPDLSTIYKGVAACKDFEADVVIALGGGSPIDAGKMIWLLYEHPELKFEDLALRFMDIRKRIYEFPALGNKSIMVAIPTTSGTGSEVTPFAVVTDEKAGIKYPIADYALTPTMAIVDSDLVMDMPKSLVAFSGLDAMTHCIETFASVFANQFSDADALEGLRLVFKYLRRSYTDGKNDPKSRERMHAAATLAGMAFANAMLGICHSMAHKLGSAFNIPHGYANALLISHVILYNATDKPHKQGVFPQYKYPFAKERYGRLADHLGFTSPGMSPDEKVKRLVEEIEKLKADLGVKASLKDYGVSEQDFLAKLPELSQLAFDDQCTGGNPRYPLISELESLYKRAYYGELF